MDDYEKYQKQCKRIRAENERLLADFAAYLGTSGLSKKTVDNHVTNTAFYINEYLLYEDAVPSKEGLHAVGVFFGYWFIKKAMWASQDSMRGTAASLKKFYTFLCSRGVVAQEDLTQLKETIKECMPDWLASLSRWDDLSVDDVWE
ncbi:MAG: recombinase [bacterium]|nr:recombinase [bacterium]